MPLLKSEIENRYKTTQTMPAVIAVTETHLKSYISKAQVKIPNYEVYRSDRGQRTYGGVSLYIHQDIPVTKSSEFDNRVCEAVTCVCSTQNSLIICAYRPPDASCNEFFEMLSYINNQIEENEQFEITILGDFNFPNISWVDRSISPSTVVKTSSAESFLQFLDSHFLSQIVDKPTRENNILDLIITNSQNILQDVRSDKTILSDHNIVEVAVTPNHCLSYINQSPIVKPPPQGFRALSLSQANFKKINQSLKNVNWSNLRSNCSSEDFPEVLNQVVLEICSKYCPKKSTSNKYRRQRQKSTEGIHSLRRKKRKLKNRLLALSALRPSSPLVQDIKKQIGKICLTIKNKVKSNLNSEERNIIKDIKDNPKSFFSYVKSKSKSKSLISLLIDKRNNIVTDPKKMADLFQDFFTSVFSDPGVPDKKMPDFTKPNIVKPL